MKFCFHYRKPFNKQLALYDALIAGSCGDIIEPVHGFDQVHDVDGLIMLGIGGYSRSVFDAYKQAGKRIVFFDKGYSRGGGWFRVAVDGFQPLAYLDKIKPAYDRAKALDVELKPYKQNGAYVLFDGASSKYCLWHGLGEWVDWGARMVRKIETHSDLPIIYRPRPSHNPSPVVQGAETSERPLNDDFARARIVVSYGGNIGFDAVIAGVPHFAIGDSIARSLSQTDWTSIDRPHVPSDEERRDWLARVANCQFTLEECASGLAWRGIRETLDAFG